MDDEKPRSMNQNEEELFNGSRAGIIDDVDVNQFPLDTWNIVDSGDIMLKQQRQYELNLAETRASNDSTGMANALANLGCHHGNMGHFTESIKYLKKALRLRRSLPLGMRHLDVADTLNSLAAAYLRRGSDRGDGGGDYQYLNKVVKLSMEAVSIASDKSDGDLKVATALNYIGMAQERLGLFDDAFENYEEALRVRSNILGEDHPSCAICFHNIGNIHVAHEEYNIALEHYTESLSLRISAMGKNHPSVAMTLNSIGIVHVYRTSYDEALLFHERALLIWRETMGHNASHPAIAETLFHIGVVLKKKVQLNEAIEYFIEALRIFRESGIGLENSFVKKTKRNIAAFEQVLDVKSAIL